MKMKASISGRKLGDVLKLDRATWQEVGNTLRANIQARTRQGVDADGQPFEPYSEGYAAAKAKQGASSRVNLTSTQAGRHMMTDLKVTVQTERNPRVVIDFATSEKAKLAHFHMGEGKVDREFFGMNEHDEDQARQIVADALKKK